MMKKRGRRHGQVVRQKPAKLLPPVRIRVSPFLIFKILKGKCMLKRFLISVFILLGLFTGSAFAIDIDFNGYIADKANLLSPEPLENLNYTLHDLNKKTTASIALVTLSSLNGEKIEDVANKVMIEYKIGDDSATGQELREAFGLRSANFDIAEADGKVKFTVRGFGHGVGMSQFGADYMAKQGSGYREILQWYYPGSSVGKQ